MIRAMFVASLSQTILYWKDEMELSLHVVYAFFHLTSTEGTRHNVAFWVFGVNASEMNFFLA